MDWNTEKLKSYIVYGIIDPDTNLYVYIGSTKNRLWDRKNSHGSTFNTGLSKWLLQLKTDKKKPIFVVVHQCDIEKEDLDYWEYFYIKKFRDENHPLLNIIFREIPYPKDKINIINVIKEGKYNNAWIANELYKPMDRKSAIAKFRNKLQNVDGRTFTAEEINKIEIILK